MQAIAAMDLRFRYGAREVVAGVNLSLPAGGRMGLLGPNGAGKSTLIGLLTGLLHSGPGQVRVFGQDPGSLGRPRPFGLVAQEAALFPELTVEENLRFFARMAGVPRPEEKARINRALELAALEEYKRRRAGTLSGGMRRRLHVAAALLHRPRLLILDEPTEGVDPQSRLHIHRLLRDLNREEGVALLVTSHHLDEVERLCEEVLILDHGRVVAEGPLADLGRRGAEVQMECSEGGRLLALLREAGLSARMEDGRAVFSLAHPGSGLEPVLQRISTAALVLERLEVRPPSLEGLFFDLTGSRLRDEEEKGA